MRKVIHLIPYDGIGGVEIAARSMDRVKTEQIDFRVDTIFSKTDTKLPFGTFNPVPYMATVWRLWSTPPNLLVLSLWRSCIVGMAVKLLCPNVRVVLFLHCPESVHVMDRLFSSLIERMACCVWADSQQTLTRRMPKLPAYKGRVISFITARIQALPGHPVGPVFVFWGRINALKGLERAINIFASLQKKKSDARLLIVGPDGGDLARIKNIIDVLGLHRTVKYLGSMDFQEIRAIAARASFYLQTSVIEGMGMSVVEAMQLGLVPVVTPVGEIAQYARHGENAVVVTEEASAIADVLELINDDQRYQKMRQQAIETWTNKPLYKDSVLNACQEVLEMENII
jgi:glycosyltransferase involved in cell wall biosynthesis